MIQSMKKWASLGAVVIGVSSYGVVQAQGFASGPAIAAPVANWSYLNHSSTAAEGALRGQAAVISAAGQNTYMSSLASINFEEAYKRAIENSVAVTKAYYERREIREEFMKKYGPRPFVGEARRKAIEYYQPKRLSAQEFNSQKGQIAWPHILRQEQFTAIVTEIDALFASRDANNSGDGSLTQRQIAQLCHSLDGTLKENIGRVTADQYITSKEFIRSVDLEAKTSLPSELTPEPAGAAEEIELDPASNEGVAPVIQGDTNTTFIDSVRTRVKI